MAQRTYIQLGRTGDIISLLPLLWSDHQKGERSAIMVAKEFAPVLDGCSYLDPIIFDGEAWELGRACEEAAQLSDDIRVCQVLGPEADLRKYSLGAANPPHAITESFQKESWRLAGREKDWKLQLPLIFDRRNHESEGALLKELPKKKKVILVSASGNSSPFPYRTLLFELLQLKFKKEFYVVDLAQFKAARIYDLLGLFEVSHCLVATDSAPLHLAYACGIPVVALINDKPSLWHGSVWRPNHIAHIRYKDFAARATEMLEAIEGIKDPGTYSRWGRQIVPGPSIIHTWSQYELAENLGLRHSEAKVTWQAAYEDPRWIACPVELGSVGKDSRFSSIKDEKRFPFLKDVIRIATLRAKEDGLICLTRADTCFRPGLAQMLTVKAPCYAHRIVGDRKPTWHPAVDLFCFTKGWWQQHQSKVPDLILGVDHHWHRILREVIRLAGGQELRNAIYRGPAHAAPATVSKQPPRVQHNENLANPWLADNCVKSLVPAVSKQHELFPLNRRALLPFGYNPSLIRFNNRLLMAYRYHDGEWATGLAVADLAEDGNVTNNRKIVVDGNSVEDPRLYIRDGKLYMGFVDSTWPDKNPKCITRYGELLEGETVWRLQNSVTPNYRKNDGKHLEKNWVPWVDGAWLYESSPKQNVVVLKADGRADFEHECDGPEWAWGTIKGGTTPIPWKGQLLRFFHSTLDNEPRPWFRRYYVGATVHEAKAPWPVVDISKEPVIWGSEEDELAVMERSSAFHFKAKVVFPAGCIEAPDGWLLSVGVNDSACAIVKLREKDLNL